jgi:putative SOS response-associated peptidase YedK
MCGRYSQAADMAQLAKRFGIELAEVIEVKPRYNLAPSEEALTIVLDGSKRRFEAMKWGVTHKVSNAKKPYFITNLRAEKLIYGGFLPALSKRRCLVPADGFYEWKGEKGNKQPFRFTMKDDSIFAFPAIYDEPQPGAKTKHRTFTIFTLKPNTLVAKVHDRMPAILPREWEGTWLDQALQDAERIIKMLQPYPADKMKSWAVSPVLNSARIDAPELIKPI